ncbi:MAG: benzoate-CoA ligase family protein [Ardenticatenales bacterium]|nr:benzoate-CoA ligase family protein [Ardenticatenales bacterium]
MNALRADDLPLEYNAVDILERNLSLRAAKTALHSDTRNLTFGEVSAEVNQVTNGLRSLGVRFGETVAILCLDTPEFVCAFFGTIKAGAVAASFNTLLKPADYRYALDDCRARVLFVDARLLGSIAPIRATARWLEHVIVVGGDGAGVGEGAGEGAGEVDGVRYGAFVAGQPTAADATPTHRDDFCCLNYSSGTTGEAKGILHAHKDLPLTAHNWGLLTLGLREDDRTFAAAKLFFTFGTGGNLVFPWYVGASVTLFAGPPRDPHALLGVIARHRPTVFYNAPTGYGMLLSLEDLTTANDLSSLRLCVSAGEALPAPIWHAWKARTGLGIVDGIGSTENYHIFVSNRPDDIRPGSSGTPVPGYDVRIVDEGGDGVPDGEIGNLLVRGETAALFYLHQSAKSRTTFLGEWLFTGDKYRRDGDGYYWHEGRSDDMLKVGGIWVSPVEVESALLSHDAVLEVAVVGVPDANDLVKPKAYVVVHAHAVAGDDLAAALIAYCRDVIAEYKRPRWIVFVDDLPKTATGKIQRFRLRDREPDIDA